MPLQAQTNDFQLDERLHVSTFNLVDWPLSRVLLKNNADYPWCILVPRQPGSIEITELSQSDRYQLMDEIHQLSRIMQHMFMPDKLNIGSLGNMVTQMHIHVVARFKHDPLWPHGVWQSAAQEKSYVAADRLIAALVEQLRAVLF